MKPKILILLSIACLLFSPSFSQDTFSICAVDTVTGEVGSAGASCIDGTQIPGGVVIISDVQNGIGVIHTQAYWATQNQVYANLLMSQGLLPQQIIDSLMIHDIASGGFRNTLAGGIHDSFVAAFDSSGNRTCATYYGGVGLDYQGKIAIGPFGTLYLSGSTESYTNIASGGFQNAFAGGTFDAFLVKFNTYGLNAVIENTQDFAFTISPNPSDGIVTITSSENIEEVEVYDVLGNNVLLQSGSNLQTVDLSGTSPGIYFMKIKAGTKSAGTKS